MMQRHTPAAPPTPADLTMQERWVDMADYLDAEAKRKRFRDKGYTAVLDRHGNPICRVTDREGRNVAQLWAIPKIKRNINQTWLKRRSPAVLARILRLNQTIGEGERIRGWHQAPTLQHDKLMRGLAGFADLVKVEGLERAQFLWRNLHRDVFIRDGKRKRLSYEMLQDRNWRGLVFGEKVSERWPRLKDWFGEGVPL